MTDAEIIYKIGGPRLVGRALQVRATAVHNWVHRGIPAMYRPTVWAILEKKHPAVAAELVRDEFLNVFSYVDL